jgi:hypothetical protein
VRTRGIRAKRQEGNSDLKGKYLHPSKKSQQLLFRGQYFWAPYDKTFVLLNKYYSGHQIKEELEGIMWNAWERRENECRVLGGKT